MTSLHLPMPGKGILLRVVHQTTIHRIEVNVENESIKIALVLDELRLVPALPQRPGSTEVLT